MKRKRYSQKFKNDAIKLYREQGAIKAMVAKELGVGVVTLARWDKERSQDDHGARPDSVPRTQYDRIHQELELVKKERDILKKMLNLYLGG